MMKKKVTVIILISILIVVTVAFVISRLNNQDVAQAYINELGYDIVKHIDDEQHSYILQEDILATRPYKDIWSIQQSDSEQYIGKEIKVQKYQVSNHPIEQAYLSISSEQASEHHYYVEVFISDEEVIGGISYPLRKDGVQTFGEVYPINITVDELLH